MYHLAAESEKKNVRHTASDAFGCISARVGQGPRDSLTTCRSVGRRRQRRGRMMYVRFGCVVAAPCHPQTTKDHMLQEIIHFPQRQPALAAQQGSRRTEYDTKPPDPVSSARSRQTGGSTPSSDAGSAPMPVGTLESVAIQLEDGRRNSGAAFGAPPVCNNCLTAVRSREIETSNIATPARHCAWLRNAGNCARLECFNSGAGDG